MTDFLPADVVEALRQAQAATRRRRARLRVVVDGQAFPVLRFRDSGFTLAAEGAPRLRGYVDIHEGDRHAFTCLVVSGELEGDEQHYEFKWIHPALDSPPLDFARDPDAPVALLT